MLGENNNIMFNNMTKNNNIIVWRGFFLSFLRLFMLSVTSLIRKYHASFLVSWDKDITRGYFITFSFSLNAFI